MNVLTVNVLFGERFDFEDAKGRRVRLGRLYYTDGDVVSDKFKVGLQIKRVSCDFDVLDDLGSLVPGEVSLKYRLVSNKSGTGIHVIGVD